MLHTIQKRYASVLRKIPPLPYNSPETKASCIITPASLPITALSNNAFHPDYIPPKTKERLALNDLYTVLNNSKLIYKMLQDAYIGIDQPMDFQKLLNEQWRLIQQLKKKK